LTGGGRPRDWSRRAGAQPDAPLGGNGSRGVNDTVLQRREIFRPAVVGRVKTLIDNRGAGCGSDREVAVGNIAATNLDIAEDIGGTGSVHRPHRQPATRKLVDQCQPDRAGSEHDVDIVHGCSLLRGDPGRSESRSDCVCAGQRPTRLKRPSWSPTRQA